MTLRLAATARMVTVSGGLRVGLGRPSRLLTPWCEAGLILPISGSGYWEWLLGGVMILGVVVFTGSG